MARYINSPRGIALTGTTIYVADTGNNTIRKVTTSGVVAALAGYAGVSGTANGTGTNARFNSPCGVAVDGSNNVYVADTGNCTIRKIASSGSVTTFAGSPGVSGTNDGPASSALFSYPQGIAVDASGNLYIADTGNCTIRKISAGTVTTIGGVPGIMGSANGFFSAPSSIAVSSGTLYVADSANHRISQGAP